MERDIVAVFGAHPDDLDWAAGGTAAVWAKQGKDVYYVLTTSGESGEDHINKQTLSRAEMADIREAEQRIAAGVLGVKEVVFLRLPDGRLEPNLQLRDCLVNVLRRLKPDIVISLEPTQGGFDNFYLYHPDHRATAIALYDAIYPRRRHRHLRSRSRRGAAAASGTRGLLQWRPQPGHVCGHHGRHRPQGAGADQPPQPDHQPRADRRLRARLGRPTTAPRPVAPMPRRFRRLEVPQ